MVNTDTEHKDNTDTDTEHKNSVDYEQSFRKAAGEIGNCDKNKINMNIFDWKEV